MQKFSQTNSLGCWHCTVFIHIFWACLVIATYWSHILQFITSVTTIPVLQDVGVCLLGLIEPLAPKNVTRVHGPIWMYRLQ